MPRRIETVRTQSEHGAVNEHPSKRSTVSGTGRKESYRINICLYLAQWYVSVRRWVHMVIEGCATVW